MENKVCITCKMSFPIEDLYYKLDALGNPKYPYCNSCISAAFQQRYTGKILDSEIRRPVKLVSKDIILKDKPNYSLLVSKVTPGEKRLEFDDLVNSGAHILDAVKGVGASVRTAYKWMGFTNSSMVRCLKCNVEKLYDKNNFYVYTKIKENFCVCRSCLSIIQERKDQVSRQQYGYRRRTNPSYKLADNLRTSLWCAINRQNSKKSSAAHIFTLLGCTLNELKKHLESQFKEGMTWDNYGRNGWHVDHIRPCASFDLMNIKQLNECFHYTNLQPLWEAENIAKSSVYKGSRYRMGTKL